MLCPCCCPGSVSRDTGCASAADETVSFAMTRPYRYGRNAGQELVEYALILPVLLILLYGIMEFGRVVMTYNTLANAAREGARKGIVYMAPGQPDPVIIMCGAAQHLTVGLVPQPTCPGEIQPLRTSPVSRVEIIYPVRPLLGPILEEIFVLLGYDDIDLALQLHAVATMRRE